MKSNLVVGVGAGLVGLAAGWFLKPGGSVPAEPAPTAGLDPKRETRPDEGSWRPRDSREPVPEREPKTGVRPMAFGSGFEASEDEQEIHRKMMDAMNERSEKQDELKVAEFIEKFGLSAEQEAKLRDHLARRREAMSQLMSGQAGEDVEALLSGDGFDQFAAAELTPEQLEAYEVDRKAKRKRAVESRALKSLAKLNQMIELRSDQRDAVYDILYQEAESEPDVQSSVAGIFPGVTESIGIEIDPGIMGMSFGAELDEEGKLSPEDLAKRLKESRRKRIDESVDRLSGVLDEDQQEKYRRQLESQGSIFEIIE